jgi:hypothetical protein
MRYLRITSRGWGKVFTEDGNAGNAIESATGGTWSGDADGGDRRRTWYN